MNKFKLFIAIALITSINNVIAQTTINLPQLCSCPSSGPSSGPCTTPSAMVISPMSASVSKGGSSSFSVTGGTPGNITWTVSPTLGVTPNSGTGNSTGNIKFDSAGTYTVTFSSTNNSTPASCSPSASNSAASTVTVTSSCSTSCSSISRRGLGPIFAPISGVPYGQGNFMTNGTINTTINGVATAITISGSPGVFNNNYCTGGTCWGQMWEFWNYSTDYPVTFSFNPPICGCIIIESGEDKDSSIIGTGKFLINGSNYPLTGGTRITNGIGSTGDAWRYPINNYPNPISTITAIMRAGEGNGFDDFDIFSKP